MQQLRQAQFYLREVAYIVPALEESGVEIGLLVREKIHDVHGASLGHHKIAAFYGSGIQAFIVQELFAGFNGHNIKEFNQSGEHNQAMRRMARKILSGVVSGEVDKGGRLTLNAALKEYAGIDGEVHIVGNNNHIELWSPEEWAKELALLDEQSTDELNINF